MSLTVLITGGAGFIGSHLADELLASGYKVRALDNLSPQVHGKDRRRPAYLDDRVELQVGDVRDSGAVESALRSVDAVVHLAAAVGVGQSMYEIAEYTQVNSYGTAVLMQALADRPVEKLIVASSMSIYGEGLYRMRDGRRCHTVRRTNEQLRRGAWEPTSRDGELIPMPTDETKAPSLASIYALNKYEQERMCLIAGRAYNIPTVALRLFNTYGPRQSLSNPYTGVLAIFASRLLNRCPPLVFEDGFQMRDFVSVHDVVRATRLALEDNDVQDMVLNIGSGVAQRVIDMADQIAEVMGCAGIQPEVTGRYRVGDIRHCFADIGLARDALGYEPRVSVAQGLGELAEWLEGQEAVDRVDDARRQLEQRGLTP
jgi:dTDP-L-rhamnose 4-epimerase